MTEKGTSKSREEMKMEIQKILDRERWHGYVSGKVDGALNVLYALDLSREERIQLLAGAADLSLATATDFIEDREKSG